MTPKQIETKLRADDDKLSRATWPSTSPSPNRPMDLLKAWIDESFRAGLDRA